MNKLLSGLVGVAFAVCATSIMAQSVYYSTEGTVNASQYTDISARVVGENVNLSMYAASVGTAVTHGYNAPSIGVTAGGESMGSIILQTPCGWCGGSGIVDLRAGQMTNGYVAQIPYYNW